MDVIREHFIEGPYGFKSAIRETDPAPRAAWTKAGVNKAEFGLEVA